MGVDVRPMTVRGGLYTYCLAAEDQKLLAGCDPELKHRALAYPKHA